MGIIGEIMGGYRRHPPASSALWQDADPLDAGDATDFDSNLSRLTLEGLRHLWTERGPGQLAYAKNGWDLLVDAQDSPAGGFPDNERAISWDRRTAYKGPPFNAIFDRDLAGGGAGPRIVRVRADVHQAVAGTFTALFALTSTDDPPSEGYLAFEFVAAGAIAVGANAVVVADLAVDVPRRETSRWRSRPDGDGGAAETGIAQMIPWFGWLSTNTGNAVLSVVAYEVR